MSDAPERIWALHYECEDEPDAIAIGYPEKFFGTHEYVRADRIEKLEAKLAKAVEALKKIETGLPVGSSLFDGKNPLWRDAYRDLQRIARITLAELKGEDRA